MTMFFRAGRFLAAIAFAAQLGFGPPALLAQYGPGQGQPNQGERPAVPPQNLPPPPFQLSPQEQADLGRALAAWEQKSSQVKTFKCNFRHWVYDSTYMPARPGQQQNAWKTADGELKFAAPDKGSIRETAVWTWEIDPKTRQMKAVKLDHGEEWACDGKKIYSVNHDQKTVEETPIPRELQGQMITEGPLPFAFGTKADKLRERYYLRLITPKDRKDEVWLEILPKQQRDAANFSKVEVILRSPDMQPSAIRIEVKPNDPRTGQSDSEVYEFEEKSIIKKLFGELGNLFSPDTFVPAPAGYKHYQNIGQQGPPPGNATPPGTPQAQRQTPNYNR